MKHIASLVLTLTFALLLSGCGSSGPSATAEKFFAALADKNIDEAKAYVMPAQRDMLGFFALAPSDELAKLKGVKAVREEIDGDRAKVYLVHPTEEGEESIDLRKVDGEWLVDMGDIK